MLNRTLDQFHRKVIADSAPAEPMRLTDRHRDWAHAAFLEETEEFVGAKTYVDELDACVDLAYFALGRAYSMGANIDRAWSNVQYSNMSKQKGRNPSRPDNDGKDATKPAGWQPPAHETSGRSRICVIGDGRSGKDTVAEMICELYPGYTYQSSSRFCLERFIWPEWGRHVYDDPETCFRRRGEQRMKWRGLIREWLDGDEAKLGRELFQRCDIYCGCRAVEEMTGMMREGLVDLVIWVHRPSAPEDASNALTREFADAVVYNTRDLAWLREQVGRIAGVRPGAIPI